MTNELEFENAKGLADKIMKVVLEFIPEKPNALDVLSALAAIRMCEDFLKDTLSENGVTVVGSEPINDSGSEMQ